MAATPPDSSADGAPAAPVLVSMAMGYGHLRAAHALAEELGTDVLHADRPPLADGDEQKLWEAARRLYEWTSRASQIPVLGRPVRWLLETVTAIPRIEPRRDLTAPDRSVKVLARLIDRGLGGGLARHLATVGAPLLTTYFAPALAVDDARRNGVEGAGPVDGPPLFCVVTDVDLARAWVGRQPQLTRIRYLVPSRRAVVRLRAYGVPPEQIVPTGFPLPGRLLGGGALGALRQNLARRLVRLDPAGAFRDEFRREIDRFLGPLDPSQESRPVTLAYVVGGAGAQAEIAERLLRALAAWVDDGRLRLALVAGTRPEVAASFERWTRAAGLAAHLGSAVEVVYEPEVETYFRRFNRLLADVDVLWTKPSELTFFAALGLPLVLAPPVGVQERHNRRWAQQRGAALRQARPRHAAEWLHEWLRDGTLAMAAWNGYLRLPKFGLYQILEEVGVRGGRVREGKVH